MKTQNIFLAVTYFLFSSIITWWFIDQAKLLYFSHAQMLLSSTIAGGKWAIQILAALLFLKSEKWIFIQKIGLVCLVGSSILLPYCFFESIRNIEKSFLFSLIFAVLVMILMYYRAVTSLQLSIKWFWSWMLCLCIAVSLQIVVVFKIV